MVGRYVKSPTYTAYPPITRSMSRLMLGSVIHDMIIRGGENIAPAEVIHFVDELPKNQMGKILKTDLRKQFGAT